MPRFTRAGRRVAVYLGTLILIVLPNITAYVTTGFSRSRVAISPLLVGDSARVSDIDEYSVRVFPYLAIPRDIFLFLRKENEAKRDLQASEKYLTLPCHVIDQKEFLCGEPILSWSGMSRHNAR
jgi:non-ribosomal peptide synthetase component E (peptide arylation enzyme)